MSLLVRTSTDAGALLVRDTDDPLALRVRESTSPLALRVRESTSPLAMRVRGLFSPASLPGLAAWYDASDAATVLTSVGPDVPAQDGQTVRRWLDKSGNNRHLEQGDIVLQPEFTNAATGLTFDGANDSMAASAFSINVRRTVFMVVTSTSTAAQILMETSANANLNNFAFVIAIDSATTIGGNTRRGAGPPVQYIGGSYTTRQSGKILLTNGSDTTQASQYMRQNGVALTKAAPPNAGDTTDSAGNFALNIGSRNGASGFTNGVISEIIIANSFLDSATVAKTEAYLARKWGVTLL
jgi:hypothetical protein